MSVAAELVREGAEAMDGRLRLYRPGEVDPDEAGPLLGICLRQARSAQELWTAVEAGLETKGFESRALAAVAAGMLRPVQACERLLHTARDLLGGMSDQAGAADEGLASLEKVKRRIEALLELASRPLPPIDQARLAEGVAAAREGRVVGAEDLLAELRSHADR